MPLFTKPQFNSVWASTGMKLAPEVAKINQGWVVEIPPHEFDNWMQNRQDALLAHLNQLGIPQWDSTVEYQAGKSYVQGTTTGIVYKALTTHFNVNPETDIQNNWVVAFQSSGESLLKVNNLSDVPDKAQARVNLGIATTEFYDTRYLLKSVNLADVPNKASARSNLDIYSKQEVVDLLNSIAPAGEVSAFARYTAPDGWLVCDGSVLNRVTYSRLFAAIGTTFGAGNGSTTFNLPDLRGEFVRGWSNGRPIDYGRAFGSVQVSALEGHSHRVPVTVMNGSYMTDFIAKPGLNPVMTIDPSTSDNGFARYTGTESTTGGAETRPRNIALLYCIRY